MSTQELTQLDDFIDREAFCRRYGISYRCAEMMAHQGRGPKVTRLGRKAWYHKEDIAAWLDAQRAKADARFARKAA